MSEDSQTADLGPAPDPEIEPGEPNPGGADAIEYPTGVTGDDDQPAPVKRDLDPDSNPAVEDALPDEMKKGEDTSTEATKGEGDDGDGVDPKEESPV